MVKVSNSRLRLSLIAVLSVRSAVAGFAPAEVSGTAVPGAVVVACTGEIAECDAKGNFKITVPVAGVYGFKAMADGKADAFVGNVKAPAEDIRFEMKDDPGRKVIRGTTGGPAHLEVITDGKPVRSFDVAGNELGAAIVPKGMWHHDTRNFHSQGEYAFTAKESHSVRRMMDFPELRQRGWYKGDFHAHVIHGENTYKANLQLMASIARAERYDWIWFAQNYSNDGQSCDAAALCKYLSTPENIVAVNTEHPKNVTGHYSAIGVEPLTEKVDPWKTTTFEFLKSRVFDRGGVAIPVHPLYDDPNNRKLVVPGKPKISWMTGKEIFLWLACEPEMCPVLDLFYFNNETPKIMAFWGALLDRGYRIAASGTSDAAYDVGRTPGTEDRPATFAKLEKLDFAEVVKAFKERRTMVSRHGAGVILEVDGKTSGDILPAQTGKRRLACEIFDAPSMKLKLHIVRGGGRISECEIVTDKAGRCTYSAEIEETENSWALAYTSRADDKRGKARAVASPVYFRNAQFRKPEKLPFPHPFPEALREKLIYADSAEELTGMEFFDEVRAMVRSANAAGRN